MSSPRRRVPYFNVPASQQPLRIRARDIRQKPRPPERDNPLEQLIVGHLFHALHPDDAGGLREPDWLELRDAAHEDAQGRLPQDPGYDGSAIWRQSIPEPADPGELEPVPETLITTGDLIPDWVLADARDLAAGGLTVRKIAQAVLPATGCCSKRSSGRRSASRPGRCRSELPTAFSARAP